jgi:heptose-I-phosphate ethanolaminephosphotransferase
MYGIAYISKIMFLLGSMFVVISNVVYLHLYLHWGLEAYKSRLQVAMFAPSSEKMEYLSQFVTFKDIIILIYVILYIYFIYKYFRTYKNQQSLKIKVLVGLFLTVSILIVSKIWRNPFTTNVAPYNYLYTYLRAGGEISKIIKRNDYIKNHIDSFMKEKKKAVPYYDKVVVIIGESASRNHMSCYGYKRKTTPFFDKIVNKKNSIFIKAFSPGNRTGLALPLELSEANVEKFEKFYQSFSLVTYLKRYGYITCWISNQGKVGDFDNLITSIAKEADKTFFLNALSFSSAGLDSSIIDVLPKCTMKNKKEVIFIHLMGSHFSYDKRYDEEHRLYDKPKNTIEMYDNSIYFTDYVLSQIYRYYSKERVLFIYFSDHAELVTMHKHCHGMLNPSKEVYEVPLVIFTNSVNDRFLNIKSILEDKTVNLDYLNDIILTFLDERKNLIQKMFTNDKVYAADTKHTYHFKKLKKYTYKKKDEF